MNDEPMKSEGLPFVLGFGGAAIAAFLLGWGLLGGLLLPVAAFMCLFFRNPRREISDEPGAIVSPADGKVVGVVEEEADDYVKGKVVRISIFLSAFDVHVNRMPVEAKVIDVRYHRGRFLTAWSPEASRINERNELLLETPEGLRLKLVQIAGLVARRIVCYPRAGDAYDRGEIMGLIRFGSRVDLTLPAEARLDVLEGERVKGGSSILGRFS